MIPSSGKIEMIPIGDIKILNERKRDKRKHTEITDNIVSIGMKKPIMVRFNSDDPDSKKYELVYGQGRLESFQACGQTMIPAIVAEISRKDAFIYSLVENMARRSSSAKEQINEIGRMRDRGDRPLDIARKTGLSASHVSNVLRLIDQGEERLLAQVESGKLPMYVAIDIAEAPGDEQKILQEAYESGDLRGPKLISAKRMLESRRTNGKSFGQRSHEAAKKKPSSVKDLMEEYTRITGHKRRAIEKAEAVENNNNLITETMYVLLQDENFRNLLRAEGLTKMPDWIREEMQERGMNPW